MSFVSHLAELLPKDLPHREACVEKAARHLELIGETNQQLNLTRIVEEREAVIKHVVDCLLPWRHFAALTHVVDAGTGAGFPGIPLALVFPETRFTLLESTQKKARFVEAAVAALGLSNVSVGAVRAEDWLKQNRAEVITARAVAPLSRAIPLFAPALQAGARLLLYKGPDVESETEEARQEARKRRCDARVVARYELPDALGTRTLVQVQKL